MNRGRGGNSQTLRQMNRGLILKLIATGECTSRVGLARRTGLTKMTVSNIVSEMLEQDLISETSAVQNEEVGRNPIRLAISGQCPKVAGALIYRSRLEAVLCDFGLHILKRESRMLKDLKVTDGNELMEQLYELMDSICSGEEKILGMGVSSIGPVDVKKGMILEPLYFGGVKNVPVAELLRARYGMPVYLNHDNQCGALAELLYGRGRGLEDFLFLGLGRGIGCGMVVNGELYESQRGYASEIGHTSIDYQGERCLCGSRGCLELYAATSVVEEWLVSLTGIEASFSEFCAMENQPQVKHVLDDVTKRLAAALVNYVNILNPQMIIMGHDGVFLPQGQRKMLEQEINRLRFFKKSPGISVEKAHFGVDAQLLGGACQVMQQAFWGKLLF